LIGGKKKVFMVKKKKQRVKKLVAARKQKFLTRKRIRIHIGGEHAGDWMQKQRIANV